MFQQALRPGHVGAQERGGIFDGSIDVGLCREINNRVEAPLVENSGHLSRVCNVAAHETVARIGSDIVQIAQVSRVSEQIEVHDFNALLRLQDIPHKAGTDEPGATGN